jgi:hypothetical protein
MTHTVSPAPRAPVRPTAWAAEARRTQLAQQRQLASAQDDYGRLRRAFLDLAQADPANTIALSMLGRDLDRAHAHMQALSGLDSRPEQISCSRALLRDLGGLA